MYRKPKSVRQGQIYDVDLPAGSGSVQEGYRPAVITSANRQNRKSPTVIVAIITSRLKKTYMEEHVILPALEQDIIEKYFFQRKTLVDIACDMDLPYDLLMGHLRAIKARLVLHV